MNTTVSMARNIGFCAFYGRYLYVRPGEAGEGERRLREASETGAQSDIKPCI